MSKYEDTIKDIEKTFGMVPDFMKAMPKDVLVADWALWKKYSLEESNIPAKYRELMGLAVSANIKCPYCQFMHMGMAQLHGATEEEFSEVIYLASLTARWSAMIHAQNYDYEKFKKEIEQIGGHLQKIIKR